MAQVLDTPFKSFAEKGLAVSPSFSSLINDMIADSEVFKAPEKSGKQK